MWVAWSILLTNVILISNAAVPDPPTAKTTTIGARKFAIAEDCLGVVAFSASHGYANNARVLLSETLVNKGVGYVPTTGIFTTHCPGLYQFSFSGYGTPDLKLTLKRKEGSSSSWSPVISVGPAGGSNVILLDTEVGDQIAVFVESGKIFEGATFTGLRIAKK